jgi:hypothetical protein
MLCDCGAGGAGGFFVDLLLNMGKEGGSSIVANPCS